MAQKGNPISVRLGLFIIYIIWNKKKKEEKKLGVCAFKRLI